MLRTIALASYCILLCGEIAATTGESMVVPSLRNSELVALGYCRAREYTADLGKLFLLQNTSLRIESASGHNLVKVSGEEVSIDVHLGSQNQPARTVVHRIDTRVEPKIDIDIDVVLATLDSEAVIYWKETFKHKSYRQGILRISVDGSLEPICEGKGGIDSSH